MRFTETQTDLYLGESKIKIIKMDIKGEFWIINRKYDFF